MSGWRDAAAQALVLGAAGAFAAGLVWRLAVWLRTRSARRLALTPAPRGRAGVAWRLLRETLLFETLWRASRWTWLFGWLFHAGLVLVLLQHLRYVTPGWWAWVERLAVLGHVASALLLAGLAGLWARRVLVDRVRFITRPSDHLVLALIAAIVLSGAALKYAWPVDVVAVKAMVRGALTLDPAPMPAHPLLLAHLALGAVLIAVFPLGKLMHGPGLWVNPTRAQPDDARERGARRRG